MIWNMHIFVPGTSLPLRAQSHVRICTLVSYGDAPTNPRVWAHHSPPPKRNLRKAWFFEVVFFFADSILLDFNSILLVELNSTGFLLNSTGFLLNSTRFRLNSNQFH